MRGRGGGSAGSLGPADLAGGAAGSRLRAPFAGRLRGSPFHGRSLVPRGLADGRELAPRGAAQKGRRLPGAEATERVRGVPRGRAAHRDLAELSKGLRRRRLHGPRGQRGPLGAAVPGAEVEARQLAWGLRCSEDLGVLHLLLLAVPGLGSEPLGRAAVHYEPFILKVQFLTTFEQLILGGSCVERKGVEICVEGNGIVPDSERELFTKPWLTS
mmetsp:Transcript_36757/g.87328  ORF Transcript_36757/g.87328 Transcript_36757/m.87328 type:complete len:214 (-) Transcript_36757:632-1273(-)